MRYRNVLAKFMLTVVGACAFIALPPENQVSFASASEGPIPLVEPAHFYNVVIYGDDERFAVGHEASWVECTAPAQETLGAECAGLSTAVDETAEQRTEDSQDHENEVTLTVVDTL